MARPTHKPKPNQRRHVRKLVAAGLNQHQIAGLLGVCIETLVKHYREDLDAGQHEMVGNLYMKAYESAMGDGPDARSDRQFLLKTRGLGLYKDTQSHELRVTQADQMTEEELDAAIAARTAALAIADNSK